MGNSLICSQTNWRPVQPIKANDGAADDAADDRPPALAARFPWRARRAGRAWLSRQPCTHKPDGDRRAHIHPGRRASEALIDKAELFQPA